jgi:hypothetical protein
VTRRDRRVLRGAMGCYGALRKSFLLGCFHHSACRESAEPLMRTV